ncbi:MAG: DUF2007 domain-containing protein [Candidatus Eisenbacteria bacterium]|nr:DUF2007 domain-containing protein [Candidatus Eisenbacteria bacterium]
MEHESPAPERDAAFEVAYTASGEMEAQAIRAALEAAGIPARLKMEAAQKLFAVTVDGLGAVGVMVPADRLEEARAVIENPATPVEDMETPTSQ